MTSAPTVLYFAYGSNMLFARIRERMFSVKRIGIAALRGYKLRWHKVSVDGSGKCDVVPSGDNGATVYGVLYEVPRRAKLILDRVEGLGHGYREEQVLVSIGNREVLATTYRATCVDPALKPYTWYKAFVVAGAKEHGLPPQYIAALEVTDAIIDTDTGRHQKNMALVSSG